MTKLKITRGTVGQKSTDLPNGEESVTYWATEQDALNWVKAVFPGAKKGQYGVVNLPATASNTTVVLQSV